MEGGGEGMVVRFLGGGGGHCLFGGRYPGTPTHGKFV